MVNTETGFAKKYRNFNHKIVFLMVRHFKMSDIAQKKCDVKEEVTIWWILCEEIKIFRLHPF